MTTKKISALINRAETLGLTAREIKNKRGGFRKDHPLGSTSSPRRVVIINGLSFSHGGADQFLSAREKKVRSENWMVEFEQAKAGQPDTTPFNENIG
jgi:hypothetical protein